MARVEALAAMVKEWPTTEKRLIVPSMATGNRWLERLTLAGTPSLNVRPLTVGLLAADMAEVALARLDWQPMDTDTGLLITEQALQAAGGYFAEVAAMPGVTRAVYRTIQELRLAGLGPLDLADDAFLHPAKAAALRTVLAEYEAALVDRGFADMAALLALAEAELDAGRTDGDAIFIVPAGLRLSARAGCLLARVSDGRRRWLPADPVYGLELPARTWLAAEAAAAAASPRPLSWLFAPAEAPASGRLELFHATSPHAEVREVFRRIAASGAAWDDAEIVCTAVGAYSPIIAEVAAKLGVLVTYGSGLPLLLTKPGRAMLSLLEWIGGDWQAESLRQTLAAGDLAVPRVREASEQPSALAVARQLRRLRIGWQRARYVPALDAALVDEPDNAALQALASLCGRLLAALPEASADGTVGYADLAAGMADVLRHVAVVHDARDAAAREQLLGGLEAIALAGAAALPWSEAVSRLRDWLGQQTGVRQTPQPGHLHVSGYSQGSGAGRAQLYVVGLDAARFPGTGLQDPILLDSERDRLSPELPLAAERLRERTYDLVALLASATGEVTLSYAATDPADGARRFPAPLLLQAYRLQQGNANADYTALTESLGIPLGHGPTPDGLPLDAADWWLGQIAVTERLAAAEEAALAAYPGIAAGLAAAQARASEAVTAWDGQLSDPDAAVLDPRRNNELVLSASGVEMLATCPLKYFFHYVLKVRPPDDLTYDPARWLDAMQRGTLLHDIFAQFLIAVAGRGEPAAMDQLPELRALAERLIAEMGEAVPPPSPHVFAAEREELLRTCELFLQLESEAADTGTPRHFELDVGFDEPLRLEIGGGIGFHFRGRVDRIDALGGGRYQVWDYKTGSAWGYDTDDFVKRGRQVQHALYALAVEHVLRGQGEAATVAGSGYIFPTERGEGLRLNRRQGTAERGMLSLALGHLFDLLAAGTFVAAEDAYGCRFCDYAEACGGEPTAKRTKTKLAAGSAALRPLEEVAQLE